MMTSTQLIAVALATIFYTFLYTASATGNLPSGCVKWRYNSADSQWKYKCDGGRLILREKDLSYIDRKTNEFKRPVTPLGPELECTCDKEGTTYGYTCPGAHDCPYNYPTQKFRHLQAVVNRRTYGYKFKVSGFGHLTHRIYPDGTQIPDVVARQIEKGHCTLQCGYTHSACEKRCPRGQIPSAWACTTAHGYSEDNHIFPAQEYENTKQSLSFGDLLHNYGSKIITVEHKGVTSQLDIKIATAVTEGSCKPICEPKLTGKCSTPCESEGVSHFTCGKEKISGTYFARLATMFDRFKNRKVVKTGASPMFELSGSDRRTAVLIDGRLFKHIANGECKPICNEPVVAECESSCGVHGPSEYVCEVDNHFNAWALPDDCDKDTLNSKRNANYKNTIISFHHLSPVTFSKLSAAVASKTCRFIHWPGSSRASYYSCLGGKQKIPADLYGAIQNGKCSPGCNEEIECGQQKKCNRAGPTVCKSKQCDVQILKGLSGVAGNFVVQGRCSIVGRNKYVERKDHIWSCPGGIYIDQETYLALLNGQCEDACLNNIDCKCGDARPAVSIYSGNLPVKHNKPLAGPSAEFIVTSTHPLLPLTNAFFDVRGPRYYDISATPGLDSTIQYLNIKLTEPYTGPVSFSLNRHTQSVAGDSICNLNYARMEYYASAKQLPVVYEGTCVDKKWSRQEGPSIGFISALSEPKRIQGQELISHGQTPSFHGRGSLESFSVSHYS